MSPFLRNALNAITERTNLSTGLSHPNDKNAAKEMFIRLIDAGEPLIADEIESYARKHGWEQHDAKELAHLAAQIGAGKKVRIEGGPWWTDAFIERLRH